MKQILKEHTNKRKHIPLRRCVSCMKRKEKNELIYMIYRKNDKILFEKNHIHSEGRGIYICKQKECVNLFLKKGMKKLRKKGFTISDELQIVLKRYAR